jgi:PX domain
MFLLIMMQARGIISKTVAPDFPKKEAVGHNSDVSSAFVARRRRELQSYLQVTVHLKTYVSTTQLQQFQ